MQQMYVDNAVGGHQMPRVNQLELLADLVAPVARTMHHASEEHIFGIERGQQYLPPYLVT
jgi:hypothetical protein